MVLVAVAMIAIIAMAALSIDVVTLYLAREEAQRAADAAALAAARVISMSGLTGTADPGTNTGPGRKSADPPEPPRKTAQAVGIQNGLGGTAPDTTNVTYSTGGAPKQRLLEPAQGVCRQSHSDSAGYPRQLAYFLLADLGKQGKQRECDRNR